MSTGWQTILINKNINQILDPLNAFLVRGFTVFDHNSKTLKDFGYFLKDHPEIFSQTYKIIVVHEIDGNWTQFLSDQMFSDEDGSYRDLPDYMDSNGVLSFIDDQKLDAFWYGFVDVYYWWYEVFISGQMVKKRYSNNIIDVKYPIPEFLDEIFQISATDVLDKMLEKQSPEASIERINDSLNFPIMKHFLPISFITSALELIYFGSPRSQLDRYLHENFVKPTKLILYV